MEKHTGIIIIKSTLSGSKSDGNKAFLISDNFKTYQLYRNGVLDVNDEYFYPFHKKNIVLTGDIQRDKWILVDSVVELDDNFLLNEETNFKPIKFVKACGELPDLINSEGTILSLVENEDSDNDVTNERLYLKGRIEPNKNIYAKVNDTALLLFFQGRLSVRELFMLRNDELYIIEENSKQTPYYYDDVDFQQELDKIQCGNEHYYSIPESMRIENPFEEVVKKLEFYWMNCLSSRKNIN